MRINWLYLAARSDRAGAPVLIWLRVERYSQIGYRIVFCLTTAVRNNSRPALARH